MQPSIGQPATQLGIDCFGSKRENALRANAIASFEQSYTPLQGGKRGR